MNLKIIKKYIDFGLIYAILLNPGFALAGKTAPVPLVKHVFIVVLENMNAEDAKQLPYLKWLSENGAAFTNFHGITHPSQPNYLAMVAGDTFGATNEMKTISATNLSDLMKTAKKTWKSYAEDYPGNCFLGDTHQNYARRHEPFLSFANVSSDPIECARVVNAAELQTDVQNGTLPNYALYIPNVKNDGHDTGGIYADHWLKKTFSPLLNNPKFIRDTLFIVTFDEGEDSPDNQIYTSFYGPMVKAGSVSANHYNHYDLLKTVETIFKLGSLGRNDAAASMIQGIWK